LTTVRLISAAAIIKEQLGAAVSFCSRKVGGGK